MIFSTYIIESAFGITTTEFGVTRACQSPSPSVSVGPGCFATCGRNGSPGQLPPQRLGLHQKFQSVLPHRLRLGKEEVDYYRRLRLAQLGVNVKVSHLAKPRAGGSAGRRTPCGLCALRCGCVRGFPV